MWSHGILNRAKCAAMAAFAFQVFPSCAVHAAAPSRTVPAPEQTLEFGAPPPSFVNNSSPGDADCAASQPWPRRPPPPTAILIAMQVARDGELQRPAIVSSSGDKDWDRAALDCAGGYRSLPSAFAGRPTELTLAFRSYLFPGMSLHIPKAK
jgi:hypothetical protein